MTLLNTKLHLRQTEDGLTYQHLSCETTGFLPTEALAQLPIPALPNSEHGLVLEGKLPNWLYSFLTVHYGTAPWIACYAANLSGAVVVATQTDRVVLGQVLPITEVSL
jgi:CRISPR-associated Csx3 family protein